MSEIMTTLVEQDKPKPKYYTEKQKEYMRKYREKKGSYTEGQKKAIYKYNARIREEAKKYRELQLSGLITISKY